MDRWLFIHVMKTAGTSFRLMLESALGNALYPAKGELQSERNGWTCPLRSCWRVSPTAGSISTGAGSCVAITPCGSATSCRDGGGR